MASNLISKITFLFIVVVSNCIANICLRKYLLAAVVSATVSTILFQIAGYFVVGYLDPLFLIALIVGWVAAFLVGLVVGLVIRKN